MPLPRPKRALRRAPPARLDRLFGASNTGITVATLLLAAWRGQGRTSTTTKAGGESASGDWGRDRRCGGRVRLRRRRYDTPRAPPVHRASHSPVDVPTAGRVHRRPGHRRTTVVLRLDRGLMRRRGDRPASPDIGARQQPIRKSRTHPITSARVSRAPRPGVPGSPRATSRRPAHGAASCAKQARDTRPGCARPASRLQRPCPH